MSCLVLSAVSVCVCVCLVFAVSLGQGQARAVEPDSEPNCTRCWSENESVACMVCTYICTCCQLLSRSNAKLASACCQLIQMDIEILSKLKVTTKCGKLFGYLCVCVCVCAMRNDNHHYVHSSEATAIKRLVFVFIFIFFFGSVWFLLLVLETEIEALRLLESHICCK